MNAFFGKPKDFTNKIMKKIVELSNKTITIKRNEFLKLKGSIKLDFNQYLRKIFLELCIKI